MTSRLTLYTCRVATPKGEMTTWTAAHTSRAALERDVEAQGFILIRIQPQIWSRLSGLFQRLRTPSGATVMTLFQHLERLTRTGFPLMQALDLCVELTQKKDLRQSLLRIRTSLLYGRRFSAAARETSPHIFDPLLCALLQTAEETGHLEKGFQNCLQYLRQKYDFRGKMHTALRYPLVMLVTLVVVVGFFMEHLVPQMHQFTGQVNATPDPVLETVQSTYSALKDALPWIAGAGALMGSTLWVAAHVSLNAAVLFARWRLSVPFIGPRLKALEAARFLAVFSLLFDQKHDVLWCLSHTKNVAQNAAFKAALSHAERRVLQGQNLSHALSETRLFGPLLLQTIALGEQSHLLAPSMHMLSETYAHDFDAWAQKLSVWLPVVCTFLGGGIVLFLALTCLQPLYTLFNDMPV